MAKVSKMLTVPLALTILMALLFSFPNLPVLAAESGKLVAYYKFDGDLTDSSGQGNNGVAKGTGDITFKDAKVGKGAVFNGSNYIEVADSDSLDLNDGFTFATWIYKEKQDELQIPIFTKGQSDDFFSHSYRYLLGYGGSYPSISIVAENESDYEEFNSDTVVGTQNWTHIAVTWDGVNVKFYKNGVLTDNKQTEYVDTILHSAQNLVIGMDPVDGTEFFKGVMDELRIYNYALADKDIKALAEAKAPVVEQPEKPVTPPTTSNGSTVNVQGLVASFSFDSNLNDSSPYDNNGVAKGTGDITFKDAKVGKGAVFNGSNYIEVADDDSLDLNDAFTFATWIYKEEQDELQIPIFTKGQSDDFFSHSYRYFLGYGGAAPSISLVAENESDCDELNSDTQVGAQNWTHIAVTWDGLNVRFYKNGVLTDNKQTENVDTILHSAQNLVIGMDPVDGTEFFKGVMDELHIYNRALSDGEIKALAVGGSSTGQPQPSSGVNKTIILEVNNPMMTVNGVVREVDPGVGTSPVVIKGRAMLPIRSIVDVIGGSISFDAKEQKTTIEAGGDVIEFWAGRNTYRVNGVEKTTDAPPTVMKGRTFLPLRTATENLGATLGWDSANQRITIEFK
jgi:hypothetical protein